MKIQADTMVSAPRRVPRLKPGTSMVPRRGLAKATRRMKVK
jgi:hypothetical protein